MPDVIIRGLRRTFPGKAMTKAVDGVSLTVSDGQIVALLGPSGCGKTTTLRCLAGLEQPDEGLIQFGDRVVFDSERGVQVPTHRRGIGLVFQSYALWPHLTAYRNVEFPLRSSGMRRADRAERIAEVARTVDLDPALLGKRPGQLSGGQQQRVALARALADRPHVLLFDEPLSNLDAHLRAQLRSEIHALHQKLGFTAVYVTHDLSEALALGDRIAVMSSGRVAQLGTPLDVFENPQERSTARLLGFRRVWQVDGGGPAVRGAGGQPVAEIYARPERLRMLRLSETARDGEVSLGRFRVTDVAYLGEYMETTVQRGDQILQIRSPRGGSALWWRAGAEVGLAVGSDEVLMVDSTGQVRAPERAAVR